jgi:hypothetical protein
MISNVKNQLVFISVQLMMPNAEGEVALLHASTSQVPPDNGPKSLTSGKHFSNDVKNGQRSVEIPLPFGEEVIGRKLSVLDTKKGRWSPPSVVVGFDSVTCRHCVKFEDEVSWILLGSSKFKWIGARRNNDTPNPSYKNAPSKDEAVGRKIRVFWPGMLYPKHTLWKCFLLLYEAGSVVHSKKDTKFSSKGVQKRAQHT